MRFLSLFASAAALAQNAKVGAWYTRPVWLAVGVIVLVLILVLISLAGRRNTTAK